LIKLNLGCGRNKVEGYENIDIDPTVKPDMLFDIVNNGLTAWDDNSVDEIRAQDFLEHIPLGKTIFVIDEIYRVLKDGGRFEHFTPSTDGRGAFSDPMHLSFWNINSWFYFCPDMAGGQRFYDIKAQFKVEKLYNIITSENVIHTHGIMFKKERGE